jgi:CRP-like cAMP-binding protein/rhodanese-related sulfurtransferase
VRTMSENDSTVELLSRSRIFQQLPQGALDAIARAVRPLVLPPHTAIFREGDPGDSLYIISTGRVRIFRRADNEVEIDLSFPGPGEAFGEMALLTGEPRSADVEVLEEAHLLVLSKEDFDHVLRDFPDTSKVFFREMRQWLIRDEKRLEVEAQQAYQASRVSWLDFLVVIGISVMLAVIFNYSNPNAIPLFAELPDRSSFALITPSAAMGEVEKDSALILDARPENFYQKGHIKGAVSMPLPLFDIVYMMTLADEDKEKEIIVYGGTISKHYDLELANKLLLRGYQNIKILEGGLKAWEGKGYPVEEKTKK